VLVVEDEPGVRRLVVRCLSRLGYRVLEAASGPEAMAVWSREAGSVDLLFTDMVMPEGLSGLELAARLVALKPELRVLISSGHSEQLVSLEGGAGEGVMFLAKPYDIATLAATVRECLDRRR